MDDTVQIMRRNTLHDLGDFYDQEMVSRAHPEVMRWPYVGDVRVCLSIMLAYFMFINYIGPAMMRNKRPFDLRWLMIPYNILLVLANFCIFYEFARLRLFGKLDIGSSDWSSLDLKEHPHIYRLAEVTWYFYMTKYFELFDTVIFVLRKKERQLSRLHIIHHTTVPLIVLCVLRTNPRGCNTFFPLANAFVHCIMYTYYGIAAFGDDVTIHLKFKKYVTLTQLLQFISVMGYFLSLPVYGAQWEDMVPLGSVILAGFFFVLFCNFYWHEYVKGEAEGNARVDQNGFKKSKNL